tara:strand:+ start:3236 stop:3424 length:189 start_codon:yes stop_codon:yes gene_type:complete
MILKCEDCGSTDMLMLGAVMKWNYDKQEWDYYDSSGGYTYMCQDNYHENVDVIEIEEEYICR